MIANSRVYMVDRWIIFTLFLLSPLLSGINFPAKYTIVSLIFLMVFWYYYHNKGFRLIAWSYPLMLWLILTIYHWVNGIRHKVPEVDILDLLHGLKIFACIAIFTFLARKNFDQTVKNLAICFQVFLVLSIIVNGGSIGEGDERLSGVIIATALGHAAALSGIYIAYYSLRYHLSIIKSIAWYMLPLIVIILTQSRNSLAMFAIGILGHVIAFLVQKGANQLKTIIVILLLGMIAFGVFELVISNSGIGARLANTESAVITAENNGLSTGTIFDKIVGDRLVYYVVGWRFFLQSPVTGIGMWNYKYLSQGDYPLHTEYMVQLCEGGIIGAVIWLLFIIAVFRGVMKSKQIRYIKIIAIFSLLEILFCGVYARVFYYEMFYPIIGIAISLSNWGMKPTKKQVKYI